MSKTNLDVIEKRFESLGRRMTRHEADLARSIKEELAAKRAALPAGMRDLPYIEVSSKYVTTREMSLIQGDLGDGLAIYFNVQSLEDVFAVAEKYRKSSSEPAPAPKKKFGWF